MFITAAEAYQKSKENAITNMKKREQMLQDDLNFYEKFVMYRIFQKINKAVKKGKRCIIFYFMYPFITERIIIKLKNLGYKCEECDGGSLYGGPSPLYLEIRWTNNNR